MKRKSSIHIEQGKLGYLFHNDRTKQTANSIFSPRKNEYSTSAKEAIEIYRQELQKRSEAYTKRTGKKLHKKTITHLSAIVNLDKQHNLEDVKEIAKHLEEELGTKVFQIAVHKDEGWVDEETGEKHINYHAHLEMLGLDEQGNSVRRKLDRKFLINLQDKVAEILNMQRGINYTAERKKRPKRLDTYEYKEHARRQAEKEKETLAKVKDLKQENKRLREELKQAHAKREHYAELEQFVKDLKEQVKAKELTIEQLKEQMQAKEKELLEKIQEKSEEILSVEKKKQELLEQIKEKEEEIEHKNKTIEKLNNDVEELKQQVKAKEQEILSDINYKNGTPAPWSAVAKHYRKLYEELKPKYSNLKKQKEEERKRREKAEEKAEELKNKIYSNYVDNYAQEHITWQELAEIYKEEKERLKEENKALRERLDEDQWIGRNRNPRYVEKIEAENQILKEENGLLKKALLQIAQELSIYKPDNLFANLKEGIKKIVSRVRDIALSKYFLEEKNKQLEEEIQELKGQNSWKM